MKQYFKYYSHNYPKNEIRDFLKLLKQICSGPGHFLESESKSLEFLLSEAQALPKVRKHENLYDCIGPNYVRVNLRPFIKLGLDLEWLNAAFYASTASGKQISIEDALPELAVFLEKLFPRELVETEMEKFKRKGNPAMRHSPKFRRVYKPAYRVLERSFIGPELKALQIQNFLERIPKTGLTVIAIDGPSASGKTTVTEALKEKLDITLISVDDFFDGSDDEIGINSERIKEEILLRLKPGKHFEYQRYDCSKNEFVKRRIEEVKNIVILEGLYSANSLLSSFYDAVIYFEASEEEQLERLKKRSERLFPRFLDEWLPREKKYFQKEGIYENSDLIV